MREAALSLAVRHPEVRSLINPRQSSAITYTASLLNAPDDRSFSAGPVPGQVLAEVPVTVCDGDARSEAFLTDLIGAHFTALHFSTQGEVPPDLQAWVSAQAQRGLPLQLLRVTQQACSAHAAWDHTGRGVPLYGAQEGTLVLLRPDGHVLGRWRQADTPAAARALQAALHPN
jgi:3-(3-hydroxy-phenyl)propionate hydroxylase